MSDITFYSSSEINRATNGSSELSRIGNWRFGSVYKGYLDQTEVFIKSLDTSLHQEKNEFLKELKVVKEIRHPNLVELLGACIESRSLVYELLPELSLEDCLDKNPQLLTWQIRTRIIYQLCSALTVLYSNEPPVVHGNLKPSHIYLDTDLNIKVLLPGRSPSINPRPKGKFTEFIETGKLKLSSDTYSFGILVLTLLTGLSFSKFEGEVQDGWLKKKIDPKAGGWPFQLAKKLAYFCSKFCNDTKSRSGLDIVKELGDISVVIDEFTNKKNNKETRQGDGTTSEGQRSYSSIRRQTPKSQGSDSSIGRQIPKDLSDITLFTSSDIERAINHVGISSNIGRWRYGSIYKGYLGNTEVFIKMLDTKINQGIDDFVQEMKVLKEISHPNLLKLVGACIESRTVVYELLPDGSLEDRLAENPQLLPWQIRCRIIYQLCSALSFLYSHKPLPILHGNLNPSYVFLDANLDIKVLIPGRTPANNPKPKGKFTEYIETGNIKLSSDVYSFGVMILRLLTGFTASYVEEQVVDARKHASLKRNVDDATRSWPSQLAKRLAYFGSKFCDNSKSASGLMEEVLKNLGIISSVIDNYGTTSSHDHKDELEPEWWKGNNCSSSSSTHGIQKALELLQPSPETVKPTAEGHGSTSERKKSLLQPSPETVKPTAEGHGSTSERRKSVDIRVKPSFKSFSQKEIQDATNNFSTSSVIGEGGYGKVYRCILDNWDVAVKILDDKSDQGLQEYIKEMEVLESMRHENLIHLMGTCFKFRALVYEYIPNGSLEDCLLKRPGELTWKIRTRVIYEICTALRFLHARKPEPLVHGDLKPHNVLLDADFQVKLADFGLCRFLTQGENSKAFHHTIHVSGSVGYMDPDFLGSRKVTPGVDVYSLGKTVVRILTGKNPPEIFKEVHEAKRAGSFMTIVDPTVKDWPEDVVEMLARFTLKACKPDRYHSEFTRSFHSDLEKILDGIDN